MDDDLGGQGRVEVQGLLCVSQSLLCEHLCTVHVPPGQQQVLDLHLDSLLLILQPGGVVQVSTLISLPLLYTWSVTGK